MASFSGIDSPTRRFVRAVWCRSGAARVALFAICFLLDAFETAHALDPERLLTQYGHTAWRLQDGELPAQVYPIGQSNDGYLWIGTQAGLVRFDGVSFVPFAKLAGEPLPNPIVISLLGARDGSLWMGTPTSVSRWDHGRLVNYEGAKGGAFSLQQDEEGKIWFITFDHKGKSLCEIASDRVVCHGKEDGLDLPDRVCSPMVTDRRGTFWINTDTEVVRWRAGTRSQSFPVEAKIKGAFPGFLILALEPASELWVGVPAPGPGLGLMRLVNDSWQPLVTPIDGSKLAAQALLRDRNGTLWVGTIDHGIYVIRGDHVDHFDRKDGLTGDGIYSFFEDHAGSIWVTTSQGIDRFRDFRVSTYTTKEGLSVDEVDAVLAARDGSIWVGTASGIDILDRGHIRSIRSGKELPGTQPTSMMEDKTGQMWLGVDQGLWTYSDGKFTSVPGKDGSPLGFVLAVVQDSEQDIWVSLKTNPRKIVRIRDRKVVAEYADPEVPTVVSLAADPIEGVWLGLRNGEIAHLRPSGLERFASHLNDASVGRIAIATDGTIFGATPKGLIVHKDDITRVLNSKEGLPCDEAYGFVEDGDRGFWLYMVCGLVRVGLTDIQQKLRDSQQEITTEVLDVLDGVRPAHAPFERAVRAKDGTLWFANGVSLQTIDPRVTASTIIPPVYIEQLTADHKSFPVADGPTLPALTRDVQIDYTAPELAVPQRVHFRYRLEGHDQEWTDAAARRQAFYTDLPPAEYRFHVAARVGAGPWSEAPSTLKFAVLPAFYQTRWFAVLVVAAIGTLLWMAYSWRIGLVKERMRARLEERLTERERIARELHDTFLQSVQGLMLRFQSVMEKIPPAQTARALMEKALDHADTVLTEGRDRVTQLRSKEQSAKDLPAALQDAGVELARDGRTTFLLTVEGNRRELDPVVNDEVRHIAGEALANAFRHAQAKHVDVSVIYRRRELSVSIVDDGQGFDVTTVGENTPAGHWGLQGMKERAKKIRAKLELSSGRDIGTAVELKVPASIAFRRTSKRWHRWLKFWRIE